MSALISVIMPVKNAAPYLKECLDSIIIQSYTNWELIAVDDHSSDASWDILDSYSKKDKRIQCFKNSGNGIIEALRMAYENSKGKYISRMDADDIMPEKKLETLYRLLEDNGAKHVSTGKVKYFSKGGVSDGYLKYQNWLNKLVDLKSHWDEIYKECVIASPAWMIRREDLDSIDAFNPNDYPEDYDLVFRFYEKGLKVIATQNIVHLWRDHQERTSRNHEHYQANSFFAIKLRYFFKMDRDPNRPLVIWGAGPKGKIMAKLLKEMNEEFHWVSNNPNKHGKSIYDQIMKDFEEILQMNKPQVIVTVAQREAKEEIVDFFKNYALKPKEDYYFFR